ncbi:MAG: hypothetical protein QXP68_03555 [Thermosphaera sp.]
MGWQIIASQPSESRNDSFSEESIYSRIKLLVDKYEEILSQAKVAPGYVGVDDNRIRIFLSQLDKLLEDSKTLASDIVEHVGNYSSSEVGRLIRAYYNYLRVVGVPYLVDLLEELRNKLVESSCKDCVEKAESLITGFRSLMDTLRPRV